MDSHLPFCAAALACVLLSCGRVSSGSPEDAVQATAKDQPVDSEHSRRHGTLRDAKGNPIVGGVVAAYSLEPMIYEAKPIAVAVTDSDGRFIIGPLDPSDAYALTAVAQGKAGGYAKSQPGDDTIALVMDDAPRFKLSGRVLRHDGRGAFFALVRAVPSDHDNQEIYTVMAGLHGHYEIAVRPGKHMIVADAPGASSVVDRVELADPLDGRDLQLRPAPIEVPRERLGRELARSAMSIPLQGDSLPPATTEQLRSIFCDTRLLGVGEATHGSVAFGSLREVLLFELAGSCGFNALLLEADMSIIADIDDYVIDGVGDPAKIIGAMGTWTLDHANFIAMLQRLRKHNETAARKIHVLGFDAFFSKTPARKLTAYLEGHDHRLPAETKDALAVFLRDDFRTYYPSAPVAEKTTVRTSLAAIRLALSKSDAADARDTKRALLYAVALTAVEGRFSAPPGESGNVRERFLTSNIEWLVDSYLPGTKAVIAAHNGHVVLGEQWKLDTLGSSLKRRYGAKYVSVGVFFGEGAFMALRQTDGAIGELEAFALGPPPGGSLEDALLAVEQPSFLVDLRGVRGEARTWLEGDRVTREIGSVYSGPATALQHSSPALSYDVLGFIDKVTSIRPQP